MTSLAITCPRCGYSRATDPATIPPGTVSAVCPGCRQRFSISHAAMQPAPAPTGAEHPPSPPSYPPAAGSRSASSSAQPEGRRPRTISFSFTGRASEYFGIWIVNILLKLVTCGIYSAWAKVRKRRYFFGNTLLDDSPFEYLADPLALFKGWLIGAGLFLLYMLGTKASPSLSILFVLIFFSVTPWLIVRSRMFNHRNTEHRGVRFRFRPNYREAYIAYAGLPLVTPLTMGLLIPYMIYRQKRFTVENSSYGRTPCSFSASAEDFYTLFVKGLGVFILILGLFFVAVALISMLFLGGTSLFSLPAKPVTPEALQKSVAVAALFLFFLVFPLYLTFAVYLETALANLTWNATAIGASRFTSTLKVTAIIWIRLSNAVAILVSLGLMTPWAAIRMARYRYAHLDFEAVDDLAGFTAAPDEEVGPAGEEIGDIFGIDVAL